ncbi:MAG: hypothetical protein D6B27_13030 [Gammaproteobacteria bacterium]|nr:MAG: hypothetical protein D6B27_13030 [Gammaproteobacteria bacterium]
MFIERFNHIKECFEYNPSTGEGKLLQRDNQEFSGIGDVYDGTIAAIYALDKKTFLQIGTVVVDLSFNDYEFRYTHLNRGKYTNFAITKGIEFITEITYPAWMRRMKNYPIGLGLPEDDEEDFLAYVKYMLEDERRRLPLLNGLSGNS